MQGLIKEIAEEWATIDELRKTLAQCKKDLRAMRRANSAFIKGKSHFIRKGFRGSDYDRITATIAKHPDYGTRPFSVKLLCAKMRQIDDIEGEISIRQGIAR